MKQFCFFFFVKFLNHFSVACPNVSPGESQGNSRERPGDPGEAPGLPRRLPEPPRVSRTSPGAPPRTKLAPFSLNVRYYWEIVWSILIPFLLTYSGAEILTTIISTITQQNKQQLKTQIKKQKQQQQPRRQQRQQNNNNNNDNNNIRHRHNGMLPNRHDVGDSTRRAIARQSKTTTSGKRLHNQHTPRKSGSG